MYEDLKIHPIPDGWEECEIGLETDVWLPVTGRNAHVVRQESSCYESDYKYALVGGEHIKDVAWRSLGLIPIRPKKQEPIEFIIPCTRLSNSCVHVICPESWIGKKFREVTDA